MVEYGEKSKQIFVEKALKCRKMVKKSKDYENVKKWWKDPKMFRI